MKSTNDISGMINYGSFGQWAYEREDSRKGVVAGQLRFLNFHWFQNALDDYTVWIQGPRFAHDEG
jgi:hypothetical protein